ncbi:hypothetical protein CONPUDRAFT_81849 [Coniophora puteana RWD-64-598 SS2]|uniref:Uncharacterized protein n=1 Tax=Coniophora puteana (strain RWD-64-598) TaxID=741705 RepID=A0A5M3MTD4_CONPW|nr:uncharacterized protein CONPUDRAFT_81849 [Coniophora puteana RWD-64-598 SS2]EIW82356.1 hypothetical protein CONPUDRAFT_81849 [Coniophora puteana RWD-64-598 SS2]
MATDQKDATEPTSEDDIDTETLQAQIDMSMSLVHDVVASWMSPSDRVRLGRASDPKRLVDEQLRRPARLGVGASTPELVQASREANKLRHQLLNKGKKRTREEEAPAQTVVMSDSDEEMAKGEIGSKKQIKVDPFARKEKKKHLASVEQNGTNVTKSTSRANSDDMEVDPPLTNGSGSAPLPAPNVDAVFSPTKKKKRKQSAQDLGTPHPPGELNPMASPDTVGSMSRTPVDEHESSGFPASQSSSPARPATHMSLLNLGGPVGVSGQDANANSESKKKRKRRKKKKHGTSTGGQPE